MMTTEQVDATIDMMLNGVWNDVNKNRDLPDIFWLMGWADWMIERELITRVAGGPALSSAVDSKPQCEN